MPGHVLSVVEVTSPTSLLPAVWCIRNYLFRIVECRILPMIFKHILKLIKINLINQKEESANDLLFSVSHYSPTVQNCQAKNVK